MTHFYATIARYYDSEHHEQDDDLRLYAALVEEIGSPALVIGAGTGRVLLRLASRGVTAHGIEIEPEMLRRAEQNIAAAPKLAPRIVLHAGDALTIDLKTMYKTVLIPYNTFMHFHEQDDQIALLKRIKAWLSPDGALIIDLPNAGESFAAQDTGALTLERTFTDIETGHHVMQYSVSSLDRVEQIMEVTWIYDAIADDGSVRRTVAPTRIRYFFLSELTLLLKLAGFELEMVYGDFDGTPFEDGAPRMIVIAR
ncbi:MAG: class I SAM-dependent methyltransferase [Chloroflexota bacterium]|nr:class I SAM-dependent methyltransferase [Chloroflexota bacterium]